MDEKKPTNVFSSRLSEFRTSMGINIATFARALGVPRSTLVGWEEGKAVSIEILPTLFGQFGVDINWFFTGQGEMLRPGFKPPPKKIIADGIATPQLGGKPPKFVADLHAFAEIPGFPVGAQAEPDEPSESVQASPPPGDAAKEVEKQPATRLHHISREIAEIAEGIEGLPFAGVPRELAPIIRRYERLPEDAKGTFLSTANGFLLGYEQGNAPAAEKAAGA
jgi:Predicted transcriptional regulators